MAVEKSYARLGFFILIAVVVILVTAVLLDGLVGTQGALIKFTEEARAAVKDADFPAMTQSTRDAADSSRLAAEDLRRSLPAIRDSLEQMRELARQLEEQPESVVYGPRKVVEKHQ